MVLYGGQRWQCTACITLRAVPNILSISCFCVLLLESLTFQQVSSVISAMNHVTWFLDYMTGQRSATNSVTSVNVNCLWFTSQTD